MIHSRLAVVCGVAATVGFLCAEPVSAQVNYFLTKEFTFTTAQKGAVPILTGKAFVHAINPAGTRASVDPPGQKPGFNPLVMTGIGPMKNSGVALNYATVPFPFQLEEKAPPFMHQYRVVSGDTDAETNFKVTKLTNGTAVGSFTARGQGTGSAVSYGELAARVQKTNLTGTVRVSPGVEYNSNAPTAAGQFQGVVDPLNFMVTDIDGNMLFSQTLFSFTADSFTADLENDSQLVWDGGLLRIDADTSGENVSFAVNVQPLSGSDSSLSVKVVDGRVDAAYKAGPLFDSLILPSVGSPGSFSLALPSEYSFDYDLSRFGDQEIVAIAEWSGAGYVHSLSAKAYEDMPPN